MQEFLGIPAFLFVVFQQKQSVFDSKQALSLSWDSNPRPTHYE